MVDIHIESPTPLDPVTEVTNENLK